MDDTSESKYILYPELRGENTPGYINKNRSLFSVSGPSPVMSPQQPRGPCLTLELRVREIMGLRNGERTC